MIDIGGVMTTENFKHGQPYIEVETRENLEFLLTLIRH